MKNLIPFEIFENFNSNAFKELLAQYDKYVELKKKWDIENEKQSSYYAKWENLSKKSMIQGGTSTFSKRAELEKKYKQHTANRDAIKVEMDKFPIEDIRNFKYIEFYKKGDMSSIPPEIHIKFSSDTLDNVNKKTGVFE